MDEGRDSERDDLDGVRLRSGGPVVEYQIDIPPVNLLNYTRINYWRDEMDKDIVIQKAREAVANTRVVSGQREMTWLPEAFEEKLFQLATEWEREQCAKVCEDLDSEYEGQDVLATWCAAAIRARGESK